MTEYKYPITICTPTYNRAHTLERLYDSIRRQTFRDFEWLIIDDGSTDNTEVLIRKWLEEDNDFPIRYYKQGNGGKSRAVNAGLDRAHGRLFFIMDSDDYLTDNALERIFYWESTISNQKGFCGVAGNRGITATETPNAPLGQLFVDASALDRYYDIRLQGERAEAFYTDVFRGYKYPEFEGERFLTPAITYNRMANDGYKFRFFDEIIWVCKYLEDGLTMQGNMRFIKNPQGHGLCLREKAEFLHYPLKKKMKMWYTFYCDHTFCDAEYRLTKRQCAAYIGAPVWFMHCAAVLRRMPSLRKWLKNA